VRAAITIALAVLAACGLLATGSALASARTGTAQRDRPPECHTLVMIAPSGHRAWVVFCGSGPGNESQLQDWVPQHPQAIMDGTRVISPSACPKANPCVMIAVSTPPS
jgi:hypothetical protein